ncbi:MAG: hypothetical protein LBR88_10990 [Zoogloeaceae bacterium]|jgi:hypothetical protein|nr:hypothetical protein [Zoogloeaceae bacterium]
MKIFLSVLAFAVLLLGIGWFLPSPQPAAVSDPENFLPWQIRVEEATGQSEVFGLKPGISTLAEAQVRFGGDPELGIIVPPGDVAALEAYYARVELGVLQGRLLLRLAATPETLKAMLQRAPKAEYMESNTRRASLAAEDLVLAQATPIAALTFIPNANLDEDTIRKRFGPPVEILKTSENLTHFLYPGKGLDVILDAKGKEVLQYVAPRDFAKAVRAPLAQIQPQAAGN